MPDILYKTLYFIYGDTNYYTNTDTLNGLKSATLTTETTIVAVIRGSSSVKASDFTVKDSSGATITVTNATISGSKATITISGADITKAPYEVTYKGVTVSALPVPELTDQSKQIPHSLLLQIK